MKVLNLQCSRQHSFEGWFGSEHDFQSQLNRQLIECPFCSDSDIQKMPSAPRLNFGGRAVRDADSTSPAAHKLAVASTADGLLKNEAAGSDFSESRKVDGMSMAAQSAFLQALRHVVANTEDVGQRFAEEARRMHYGEVKTRNSRGQASRREAVELLEEGIEVMALPFSVALKETLQ